VGAGVLVSVRQRRDEGFHRVGSDLRAVQAREGDLASGGLVTKDGIGEDLLRRRPDLCDVGVEG
jgi:hypothetical protein